MDLARTDEVNAYQLLKSECQRLEVESQTLTRHLRSDRDRLERLSSSLHLTKQQIDFFTQETNRASEGIKDCCWRFTKDLCTDMGKIKSPSATLLDICEKFLLVLDQRDRSWKTFRAITHNYTPLKSLMSNVNIDLISEDQLTDLLPVWKSQQSIQSKLLKVSKGGSIIAEWLSCCVEYKLKNETLQAAKRKLPDLERKIKNQLQLIAEKNAQILTCEEKIAGAKAAMESRDEEIRVPVKPSSVSINSTSLSLQPSEEPAIVLSPTHHGTATRGLLSQISPRSKPSPSFPSFSSPPLYTDRIPSEEFKIDYGNEGGSMHCCHSRFFCY